MRRRHVAALAWLSDGKPSEAFNLGNGRGFSVKEVIKTAEKVAGRPVPVEVCARRPGDPPILISDSAKARRLLGWTPKFPGLEDQIRHAWTWFAKHASWKAIAWDRWGPHLFGAVPPKPRIEGVRVVDMAASNSWAEFATLFCSTRTAFLEHEWAKTELKGLMPEDAKEAYGHGVRAKRSK
jgi:hypothetical protein